MKYREILSTLPYNPGMIVVEDGIFDRDTTSNGFKLRPIPGRAHSQGGVQNGERERAHAVLAETCGNMQCIVESLRRH